MKNLKMMMVVLMLLTTTQVFAQNRNRDWDPEQRAKIQTERLKERLSLSEEQSIKIFEINKAMAEKMQAAREKNQEMADNRREYRQKQNEERDAEYKNVLTKEQWDQWEELKKEQGDRSGRERKGKREIGEK